MDAHDTVSAADGGPGPGGALDPDLSGIHRRPGAGSGPTLVLLHGITDAGACWDALAAALDPAYDIVMPDARGHGTSPLPEGPIGVAELAADVVRLVERLIGERDADGVVLVGHSMGAATAAAVAAERPELVRALVLEDPPWRDAVPGDAASGDAGTGDADAGDAAPGDGTGDAVPGGAETGDAASGETDTGDGPSVDHAAWVRGLQALDHAGRLAEGRASDPHWSDAELEPWATSKAQVDLRFFDRFDHATMLRWRDVVARLTVPTLLITGDPDRGSLVTPHVARQVQQLAPHVRTFHLDGTGHSIHRDRLDAVVDGIHAFLADALR